MIIDAFRLPEGTPHHVARLVQPLARAMVSGGPRGVLDRGVGLRILDESVSKILEYALEPEQVWTLTYEVRALSAGYDVTGDGEFLMDCPEWQFNRQVSSPAVWSNTFSGIPEGRDPQPDAWEWSVEFQWWHDVGRSYIKSDERVILGGRIGRPMCPWAYSVIAA